MPRLMPTTLRPRFRAQARGGGLLRHVPNRPPRFPRSTPPPGPSARPSGFSIRSQRDSALAFGSAIPSAFRPRPSKQSFSAATLRFQPDGSSKAPVRTSVATEFNPGEQRYHTINLLFQSIGNSAARGKRGDGRGEAPSQHLCDLCVLCGKNTLRPRAHLLHPPKLQNTPQRKQ